MRLMHNILGRPLEFKENEINILVVENKPLLVEIIQELLLQANGEEGRFVLSKDYKIININKSCEIITDIFSIDINAKKIITKVYNLTKENVSNNYYLQASELQAIISNFVDDFIQFHEVPLIYNNEFDMVNLFKLIDLKVDVDTDDLLEKIVTYIDLVSKLFGINLFILINFKGYFSSGSIECFYKQMHYKKINVLLIEGGISTEKIEGEKLRIIDKDLCELY